MPVFFSNVAEPCNGVLCVSPMINFRNMSKITIYFIKNYFTEFSRLTLCRIGLFSKLSLWSLSEMNASRFFVCSMDHLHNRLTFHESDKNEISKKSVLKLVIFPSLAAKCCKVQKI